MVLLRAGSSGKVRKLSSGSGMRASRVSRRGSAIGGNLGRVGYLEGNLPFKDLFRSASNFFNNTPFEDPVNPIIRDDEGWVTELAPGQSVAIVLMARGTSGGSSTRPDNNTPGNYMALEYLGTGTFSFSGGTGFSAALISHDTVSTPKRAVYSIVWGTADKPTFRLTATGAGADYFRRATFVSEADEAAFAAGEVFDSTWLAQVMAVPGPLRFMDWLETNDSDVVDFADFKPDNWRTDCSSGQWENSALYHPRMQVRLKTIVDLLLATGKEGWICVPDQMTDLAAIEMMEYFRDRVPQKLGWERSNELWNPGFLQSLRDSAAGALIYTEDTANRQNRYYGADKAKAMLEMLDTVYGPSNRHRWHGWVCGQADSNSHAIDSLGHDGLAALMVSLGNCTYATAAYVGGYMGGNPQRRTGPPASGCTDTTANLSDDEILDHLEGINLEGNAAAIKETVVARATQAVSYGLKYGFYECGQHLVVPSRDDNDVEAAFVRVNGHARMRGITYAFFNTLAEAVKAVTGSYPVMVLFSFHSDWGESGSWGFMRDQYQAATSYKWLGTLDYIESHTT